MNVNFTVFIQLVNFFVFYKLTKKYFVDYFFPATDLELKKILSLQENRSIQEKIVANKKIELLKKEELILGKIREAFVAIKKRENNTLESATKDQVKIEIRKDLLSGKNQCLAESNLLQKWLESNNDNS